MVAWIFPSEAEAVAAAEEDARVDVPTPLPDGQWYLRNPDPLHNGQRRPTAPEEGGPA